MDVGFALFQFGWKLVYLTSIDKSNYIVYAHMTASIDLQALRLRMVSKFPYLSAALWSMTLVETDQVDTMAVDNRWRLYVNPAAFDAWTRDEQIGVLLHEVQHLIRGHHARAAALGMAPPKSGPPSIELASKLKIWNIATDCSINGEIKNEVKLPETTTINGEKAEGGVCYPEKFGLPDGQIAERYFEELMKKADKIQYVTAGPLGGEDGSGSGGMPGAWEIGDGTSTDYGEGVSDAIGETIRHQVAKDILAHNKTAGNLPGYLVRWAEERLNPKVDWRTKLSASIRGTVANVSGMVDYCWTRPNRRQSAAGRVILPSLRGTQPNIALAIDTSGSMSDDLSRALAEVRGVLDTVQCRIKVYAGDTQAYEVQTVRSANEIKLTGGGGTDMGALIQAMDDDKNSFAVVISDGFTPWPSAPPKYLKKVIVVLTQAENEAAVPKFYETILVDE